MRITTTLTILGMAGAVLASPFIASAQTITPGAKRLANQEARLTMLHTLADTAITNRIASLNALSARVNGLVKLSASEKSQFNGEITADINALTTLKTKCDADTDLTTLREDYRSIFTTYRIYAEFLPQLHLLVASDTMGVTADKLNDLATKLQARIQQAGNPSNLTSLLSDMQAKIADAEKQYSSVESQISSLTPQSYDNDPSGTSSIFKNARLEIRTGASDLKAVLSDARQIIQALKALYTTPSPTGS